MPSLFGPKKTFSSKRAAEEFVRHLTRELTAGGIGHWVELREGEATAGQLRFTPFVHLSACPGGVDCKCCA